MPHTSTIDAGRQRLAQRRRRLSRIRRTVVGAAVAVFIAAFSTIYVQMTTGNDPALTTPATANATVVPASPAPVASDDDDNETAGVQSSSTPSPVTTRQS